VAERLDLRSPRTAPEICVDLGETTELRELHLFGRSLERALYGRQVLEVVESEWPGWTYCTVEHDENQARHWPFWDRELNFKLLPLTTSAWPELTADVYDERRATTVKRRAPAGKTSPASRTAADSRDKSGAGLRRLTL
jgi:hypothetical protein